MKTSTGFGPAGATEHDVSLMKNEVKDKLGVKASGGIKSIEDVERMIKAGASRIGTSSELDNYWSEFVVFCAMLLKIKKWICIKMH